MTAKEIARRGELEAIVYETARQVRELLDAAAKKYGADEWENQEHEAKVIELVTEEGES